MLIGATDVQHVLAFKPQVAHIDVGRHINAGKMPDMHRAIGIR